MSVFEVGTTISESTGGHASAGGNSGAGNRFYFSDDAHAELGLQRGNSYDVRIRLKGNTSGHIKLTMIGHRGYASNAGGNQPFCYIVEALPLQMGTRIALTSTVSGVDTKSFEDGIEAQHLMGLAAGDFYPTVSCFQYTDYTEITLRVMNMSNTLESSQNRSNVKDTTATDHSGALTKHYAGQSDVTVAGQAGEMGGDAIFFTAYIEGYSYNSTLSEGIFTSYNRFMGGRALSMGGLIPGYTDGIEYLAIGVLGSAADFGELSEGTSYGSACSNGSRALITGDTSLSPQTQYVTISTVSDSVGFADLAEERINTVAMSDGNRAVWSGGSDLPVYRNNIDYLTFANDATGLDFGDISLNAYNGGGLSDGNRGVHFFGYTQPANAVNATLEYMALGVIANAVDFGDSTQARYGGSGASDGSRGVWMGGYGAPLDVNTIDYINISTIGNAIDFGNLVAQRGLNTGQMAADGSRGMTLGAYTAPASPAIVNAVDYITISTTGNAADWGELVQARYNSAVACGD